MPAALLFAAWAAACSETEVNQSYTALFYVSNQSAEDVVVDWGLKKTRSYRDPVTIPAGAITEIYGYQRFLAPPPDANREFICVSVYRASDQRLVHQLAPVTNEQWAQVWITEHIVEFTLTLTPASLDTTLQNSCARLTGVAIDSVTSAPLNRLEVSVDEDDGGHLQANLGFGETRYTFIWGGELPAADIEFQRSGFVPQVFRLPDDATDLGDRYYELNPVLAPPPPRLHRRISSLAQPTANRTTGRSSHG